MVRLTTLAYLLLTPFLISHAWSQFRFGQSSPSEKEASAILQKTIDEMDLRQPGSPPFHLVVRVHYGLSGHFHDGKYELFWAAPDRWRENFHMDDVGSEVELVLGEKLYIMRNTDTFSLPLWRVRRTLHGSVQSFYGPTPKARRVYSSSADGKTLTCIDSKRNGVDEQLCIDPKTSQAELMTLAWKSPDDKFEFTLSSFIKLGDKQFPRRVNRHQEDEEFSLDVETLESMTSFADEIFTPAPTSTFLPWCANPTEKGSIDPAPPAFQVDASPRIIVYYVLVGTDGRIKILRPMRSSGDKMDQAMVDWSRRARFPVQWCGGKPIEYESAVFFHTIRPVAGIR